MNLILQLDSVTERKLQELAAAKGTDPAAFALAALTEKLSSEPETQVMLPAEEWHARLNALLASAPPTAASEVDDSRESIYAGRGE